MEKLEKSCVVLFIIFALSGTAFFLRNTFAPMVSVQFTLPGEAPPGGASTQFDRSLNPTAQQEAAGFLSTFKPDVPAGWQVAVIIREQGPGLPRAPNYLRITLLLPDGTQRVVEPYYQMVNVRTPVEERTSQLDGGELGTLLDVGDCIAINPRAWGRTFEDLNWGFKEGDWRILKKAAVGVNPAKP